MFTEIILRNFRSILSEIENTLTFFSHRFPPLGLNYAVVGVPPSLDNSKQFSIRDFMQDNILWAVQKNRRNYERRLKRRYGSAEGIQKTWIANADLLVCVHCGHDYKRGYLCRNCYSQVMDETRKMQEEIKKELKLDPVDQEVVVLYKGEKETTTREFWQGKRIVEMPEQRPPWFSRNLLQKTNTTTSDNKDVQPEQLG